MKKFVVSMLAIVMAITLLLPVAASQDNFVNSVAQVGKPVLQGEPEVATGVFLVLTSYTDRGTLPDGGAEMEDAYAQILAAANLGDLNAGLASAAAALGVDASDLVVSDLFDVSLKKGDDFVIDPSEYMPITVALKADLLDKFVGLLHFKDGKCELVTNANVKDGVLTFSVDDLSPFAIVVKNEGAGTDSEPESPDTGDTTPWFYVSIMAAAALLASALVIRKRVTE